MLSKAHLASIKLKLKEQPYCDRNLIFDKTEHMVEQQITGLCYRSGFRRVCVNFDTFLFHGVAILYLSSLRLPPSATFHRASLQPVNV